MMNIKRQSGIGLVEIMVSMVIALFLLLGIGTIFITTRSTYGDQQGLSNLQDNERLAMFMLTNVIQIGGYFPDPLTTTAAASLPGSGTYPANPYPLNGQAVSGTEGGAAPDTVRARFVTASGDGIGSCNGGANTSGANVLVDNVFDISGNTLRCAVNGANPQPLVTGVSDMQVLYGVDTTGSGSATQYFTAALVPNWNNVKSVRITLTFQNPLAGQAANPFTFTKIVPVMNKI
ncbi:MAG: PilW family protein [Rhizobium sp.]|nr:PilW family protein [Rhizobium sp.]